MVASLLAEVRPCRCITQAARSNLSLGMTNAVIGAVPHVILLELTEGEPAANMISVHFHAFCSPRCP